MLRAWLLLILVALASLLALAVRGRSAGVRWAASIFALGAGLRLAYFLNVPFYVRAHDWEGHLRYIDYILQNGSLPRYDAGWEMYQPPLYYLLGAGWVRLLRIFVAWPTGTSLGLLSLAISLTTLAIAVRLVYELHLRGPVPRPRLAWMAALPLVSLPGVVFLTTQVNNDILVLLIGVGMCFFAWRFWRSGSVWSWSALALGLPLGLLTKSNILALAPALLLLALAHPKLTMGRKLAFLILMAALVLALAGPFEYRRLVLERMPDLVGNIDWNPPSWRVENSPRTMTFCNPVGLVLRPFLDADRKAYHWEHLYRTALFGEHPAGPPWLASIIAAFGVGVAAFLILSISRARRSDLPWFLTLTGALGALTFIRLRHNIGGFSDFRYIPVSALPGGILMANAWDRCGPARLWVFRWYVCTFGLCSALVLWLSM